MKKTILFILVACSLLFSSCDNPAKSKLALDDGLELFYNKADYSGAAACFEKAIRYDKNNPEAYYYLGCSKFNRGMIDQSIVDFEKAIELKPGYQEAEFALGRIYFIKQDHDLSCFYYKAAEQHGRPNMEDYVRACP